MKLELHKIKTEADQLLNKSLLAKIDLKNTTHTKIGGYNAKAYSDELDLLEGLRTSEIKGIWRWWLRATLGGALWDLQKEPSSKLIVKIVREIMGSTESASKLTISTFYKDALGTSIQDLKNIPRIKLTTLQRERQINEKIYAPNSLNTFLLIRERGKIEPTSRRVAFGTLLLALLLQGVGAITRRGFGRFQLNITSYKSDLADYCNIIKDINQATPDKIKQLIDALISKVLEDAKKLMQTHEPQTVHPRPSELPPFPILSNDTDVFRLHVLSVRASDELELLKKLGNACMKINWKTKLGIGGNEVNRVLDTWILGLPRKVRQTGYEVVNGKDARRPSAIILSPIKKVEQKFIVAVYGFLSKDWPIDNLWWRNSRREKYRISRIPIGSLLSNPYYKKISNILNCVQKTGPARIKCAFDIAFETIVKQLGE